MQPEPVASPANPWRWIPTLYFLQAIPYVIAMTVSVVMYKNLGIGNTEIALYTSWLYLPWVIKPLWAPLVDMFGTKRAWMNVVPAQRAAPRLPAPRGPGASARPRRVRLPPAAAARRSTSAWCAAGRPPATTAA